MSSLKSGSSALIKAVLLKCRPLCPFLPEKFSSALQPGTLLDLLQIEGMKIEEESEVRWGVAS